MNIIALYSVLCSSSSSNWHIINFGINDFKFQSRVWRHPKCFKCTQITRKYSYCVIWLDNVQRWHHFIYTFRWNKFECSLLSNFAHSTDDFSISTYYEYLTVGIRAFFLRQTLAIEIIRILGIERKLNSFANTFQREPAYTRAYLFPAFFVLFFFFASLVVICSGTDS